MALVVATIALANGAFVSPARALTLNWGSLQWAPTAVGNTLVQQYDIDGAAGTDVTITLSYSTQNAGAPYRAGLPAIDATLLGGNAAGTESLHLGVDFNAQSHYVMVLVEFAHPTGAEGVSFSLFDLDRADGSAAYIDQIRSIVGTPADNSPQVTPSVSVTGSTTVQWSAVNQTLTGTGPADDASSAGNATINFGSTGLRNFSFRWGVPNNNANNPIAMDISIGNIDFSPVPEVNPAAIAGALCALAGIARAPRWRRKAHPG